MPLEEVSALVLAAGQATVSQATLAGIAESGGAVVICNKSYMPAAMLLPFGSHFVQTERLAAQTSISAPTRKRLWQEIVRAKVRAQAHILEAEAGSDFGLSDLVAQVRSGDPTNVEARAAQIYWPRIFGDPSFRRRRDANDQNRLLNYGYTVLRAIVARAICASGLHPSLGLHHHNRYDSFCLASDLMEPFRPLVDSAVCDICRAEGADVEISPVIKKSILQSLYERYEVAGEQRTLFDIATRVSNALARVFAGEQRNLEIPRIRPVVAR